MKLVLVGEYGISDIFMGSSWVHPGFILISYYNSSEHKEISIKLMLAG